MWCGTPCLTATFPHGLVQSRRRIRLRGRRWRVASYQRKVVEMGCSSHLPEGPRRAGGDPAPGNVATTRLPEAGVREHPAPLGALRLVEHVLVQPDELCQGAPRTARCIKTLSDLRGDHARHESGTTPHAPLARAPSACAPDLTRHRSVLTPTGRGRLPAHHPARPATGRYPQPPTRPRPIPHRLVRLRAGAGYQGEPPTTRRRNHG